ncbi:MAG: nucleoside deaminase [Clostridia bacterium]|nr:nucleoside deaminase [Clostridia bacterium]
MTEDIDVTYMKQALALAEEAKENDEVPVGAVVVCRGKVVGTGRNRREEDKRATAHAELLAIEEACKTMGGWRLPESVLYVTLEPCPMCAGAAVNARIGRVVFGARDEKGGAFGGALQLNDFGLNHKPLPVGGCMEAECKRLLQEYFKEKRKKRNDAL